MNWRQEVPSSFGHVMDAGSLGRPAGINVESTRFNADVVRVE
jgi:hypothetical protein